MKLFEKNILAIFYLAVVFFLLSIYNFNISFLLLYICILFFLFILKNNIKGNIESDNFIFIYFICFSAYTTFIVISHELFIINPYRDYLVNIDEADTFFSHASRLSRFGYAEIWKSSFTEFRYSESPLIHAANASLFKLSHLSNNSGLLFLKLIVANVGALVPAILYLTLSEVNMSRVNARKGALVYGLLGFVFFNSVGLMRDIHVSLIYVFIIYFFFKNKISLRQILVIFICTVSLFFIRIESGLYGVLMISVLFYKHTDNRLLKYFVITIVSFVIAYTIREFMDYIMLGVDTINRYNERAIEMSSNNSLGIRLRRLPFPVNTLAVSAFGQVSPFPFWFVFEETDLVLKKIFYLPQAIATLFWFLVWYRCLLNWRKVVRFAKKHYQLFFLVIIYITVISTGQIEVRRLMTLYPVIFTMYMSIDKKIFRTNEVLGAVFCYLILIVIYLLLKI